MSSAPTDSERRSWPSDRPNRAQRTSASSRGQSGPEAFEAGTGRRLFGCTVWRSLRKILELVLLLELFKGRLYGRKRLGSGL